MTLEQLDRKLQRLRDVKEQMHAKLLDVELDSNRRLLDDSQLEGQSALRWAATSATFMQLWEWLGLLAGLVERAEKLRGTRARLRSDLLAELGDLIERASIECSSQHAHPAEADPLGSSQATVRLSPEQLAERISAEFDEAKAVLARIANAWEAFQPRLRRARAMVSQTSELCQGLGENDPQELHVAHERVTQLTEALAKDPLSVRQGDVETLETSVAALRTDLDALAELRDEIGARLVGARELLEELRRAYREGEATHADVVIKIAAPKLPELVRFGGIEAELEQVIELSQACAWRQARDALAQWTTRATSLLAEARSIATDNRAPVEARNQLRGRLDAYQAKAKQFGVIEDPELSGIFERAQKTLYTAPTNLEDAEALLRSYQQALNGEQPAEELLR